MFTQSVVTTKSRKDFWERVVKIVEATTGSDLRPKEREALVAIIIYLRDGKDVHTSANTALLRKELGGISASNFDGYKQKLIKKMYLEPLKQGVRLPPVFMQHIGDIERFFLSSVKITNEAGVEEVSEARERILADA